MGSLGTALTEQLLKTKLRVLRLMDNSERALYEAQQRFDDSRLRMLLGDIRNGDRLGMAMADVDYVINCAAVKSVDIGQQNIMETIDVNVNGAFALVREALRSRPKKCLFLSSDKAIISSPNAGVYHASKYVVEELAKWANLHSTHTRFASIRPANFVPSNMSVFDTWFGQYTRKQPLTLTDAAATRYFIPLEQAAKYTIRALLLMKGGETFVPPAQMFNMLALAKRLRVPYVVTGLRPSDRLTEELITAQEQAKAKRVGGMLVFK